MLADSVLSQDTRDGVVRVFPVGGGEVEARHEQRPSRCILNPQGSQMICLAFAFSAAIARRCSLRALLLFFGIGFSLGMQKGQLCDGPGTAPHGLCALRLDLPGGPVSVSRLPRRAVYLVGVCYRCEPGGCRINWSISRSSFSRRIAS